MDHVSRWWLLGLGQYLQPPQWRAVGQTVIRGDILSIVSSIARGARPGLFLCAGKNVRSWAEWQSLLSLHLEPQLSAMHLSRSGASKEKFLFSDIMSKAFSNGDKKVL